MWGKHALLLLLHGFPLAHLLKANPSLVVRWAAPGDHGRTSLPGGVENLGYLRAQRQVRFLYHAWSIMVAQCFSDKDKSEIL